MIRKLLARGKCRALLRRATAVSHNGRMFARLMPAALNVELLSAVDAEILAPKCGSLRKGTRCEHSSHAAGNLSSPPFGVERIRAPFWFLVQRAAATRSSCYLSYSCGEASPLQSVTRTGPHRACLTAALLAKRAKLSLAAAAGNPVLELSHRGRSRWRVPQA